eukprot:gene2125-2537_t
MPDWSMQNNLAAIAYNSRFVLEPLTLGFPNGTNVDGMHFRAKAGDNIVVNQGWDRANPAAITLILPDSQHIPIWKNGKRVQWLWPDRVSQGDVVVFGSLRYVFRISVEDPVAQPVTVSLQNHVPDASRPGSLSFTLSRKLAATHTQTLPMP